MKKTLVSILCAVAMVIALFVPVFAEATPAVRVIDDVNYNGPCTEEGEDNKEYYKDVEDGRSINDRGWSGDTNTVRWRWTPSRCFDNSHAVIYTDGTTKVAKLTGKQWFDRDSGFQDSDLVNEYGEKIRFSITAKPVKITGYAGTIMSYGSGLRPERGSDEEAQVWRCGEYAAENIPGAHLGGTAGYGWTFVPGEPTKIAAYVRCLSAEPDAEGKYHLEAMRYVFDTGVDLTKDYHAYDIYIDGHYDGDDVTKNTLTVYFTFDGKLWCSIKFADPKTITLQTTAYAADNDDYYRKATIYSGSGQEYASSTNAVSAIGWQANWSVSQDGDVLYVQRVLTETFNEAPAAVAYTAGKYSVELKGKVDILNGKTAKFISARGGTPDTAPELTDGVYAADVGTKVYLNSSWIKKDDVEGATANYDASTQKAKAGGDYSFAGVDQTYVYALEFEKLGGVKADSFALYFNNEKYFQNADEYASQQCDNQFDILVSTDGGKTYQKAWSSVRWAVKENGKYPYVGASLLKSQGGSYLAGEITNGEGAPVQYRYISEKFDKKYEGVTNIVYACAVPRLQDKYTVPYMVGEVDQTFFSYYARISEFDVYDSSNAAAAATGDNSIALAVVFSAIGVIALCGTVVAVRRRRED